MTKEKSITGAVYGYCPNCGSKGVTRERRPNGNDSCEKGCIYPSATAVHKDITGGEVECVQKMHELESPDVEALKRPEPVFEDEYSPYRRCYERGKQLGWNDCLDHLHAQGYLSAKLPKIDGLDEALEFMEKFIEEGVGGAENLNKDGCLIRVRQAARAYRERME